jgi:hypothetical protein
MYNILSIGGANVFVMPCLLGEVSQLGKKNSKSFEK